MQWILCWSTTGEISELKIKRFSSREELQAFKTRLKKQLWIN